MWLVFVAACVQGGSLTWQGRDFTRPAAVDSGAEQPHTASPPDDPRPSTLAGPSDAVWGRDPLWCTDVDGRPGRWLVDGVPLRHVTDGVVPADLVRSGRDWTCTAHGHSPVTLTPAVAGGNILVLVLDDIGKDRLRSFGGSESLAETPAIDALRERGVVFERAWSMPVCSSSRAAMLTGRHPRRTGIGSLVGKNDPIGLDPAEVSIADALSRADRPYDSLLVGKWHLGTLRTGSTHPHQLGFRRHFGTMANLEASFTPEDVPRPDEAVGYYQFEWSDDGVLGWRVDDYATSRTVQDFSAHVDQLSEPWLSVVAFNGAHKPWHLPPEEWRRSEVSWPPTWSHAVDYMVESVDIAIAQILAVTPPDTTIVLVSDNGTVGDVVLEPYLRSPDGTAKGTVMESGVNVPLVVVGPLVRAPGTSRALVEITDLFDTMLAIGGLTSTTLDERTGVGVERDSMSLLPYLGDPALPSLRATVFTERFEPNGDLDDPSLDYRSVRDDRWKFIRCDQRGFARLEVLLDMDVAAVEGVPVAPGSSLEARAAFDHLSAVLEAEGG